MKDIRMSIKESRQIAIFEQLKRKEITQVEASKILRLSVRQVRRKLERYLKSGPKGLIHRSRGRPSNRKLPEKERQKIIDLYKLYYPDFGPTLASEKLWERHKIAIHPETLRLLLIAKGLWIKKRKHSSHRKWRPPKEHYGEMVQLDGSEHAWFEDRASKCTLIKFIDDATKEVWCEFAKNESHESVMQATKQYCAKHGKPHSIYSDRGGVFKVNIKNSENNFKTQYERALAELDIEIIHARSPQAKGRVERSFGVFQDRLVKELRLENISDIEGGNKFLKEKFLPKYNAKFAKQPIKTTSFFKTVTIKELENALCIKNTRKLRNDFTIRYNNLILQLEEEQKTILQPGETIQVWHHSNGKIELFIRNIKLYFKEISQKVAKNKIFTKEKEYVKTRKINIPSKDHPWRTNNSMFFK